MAEKSLYVMAGFDAETEERLAELQNLLYANGFTGTQTKGIPFHLTLGSRPADEENEEWLLEIMREVAEISFDFTVTFNHIGIFSGGKVLFAAPDTEMELLHLNGSFDFSDDSWTPHATLLIDEPSVILDALPLVLENFKPFTARIDKLYLYEFFPSRHIATIGLGVENRKLVQNWLDAFAADVPADILRDDVLKSCNLLWHAFTWGERECLEGEEAKQAFDALDYTEAICFENGYSIFDFPRIDNVHTVGKMTAADLEKYSDIYITAPDFSWTYVHTHEDPFCGPYFCRK
ncbi:MAG: DUF4275 family protein [Clostridia bacterium]|nr:DUF4275 family protein [Clostridia bacterium]